MHYIVPFARVLGHVEASFFSFSNISSGVTDTKIFTTLSRDLPPWFRHTEKLSCRESPLNTHCQKAHCDANTSGIEKLYRYF